MTVGAVTARSYGGLTPANQNRAPRTAQIVQLDSRRKVVNVRTRIPPSVSTKGIKFAIKQTQEKTLRRIAGLVVRTVSRSTPLQLITLLVAEYLWNKVVEPNSFPGFDNITEGWRFPLPSDFGFVPGDYVPNPFDSHPDFHAPVDALLDVADSSIPLGIRYWGDFNGRPYPDPLPGVNWPTVPIWLPNPVPTPASRPWPRYKPQPNINPRPARVRRERAHARFSNVQIRIRISGRANARTGSVTMKTDVPGGRTTDDGKAKPANQFIYAVLKTLADTMGETKEWIDILAEAAGYDGRSSAPLKRGQHQTVQKAWWLFIDLGINNIDFDLLAQLIIENEIEDFLIGIAGNMSKAAARSLGLTVGPQTGLAM